MAIKKIRIKPPGYTDIVHPETSADIVKFSDGSTVEAHKADYMYQIPTIVGTQIRIQQKSNINRLYFKLDNELTGNITISIDNGSTSRPLRDVEGNQVNSLDKGFVEVVAEASFFTLRPRGGVSKTGQVTNLTATVGFSVANRIQLDWTNPTDDRFKGLVIRFKQGSYPSSPEDGYLFLDTNDGSVPNTRTISNNGVVDGVALYIRAFAYTYKNATRVYTDTMEGSAITATPQQAKGKEIITTSGQFTPPFGVTSVDVFLVGGGGGGGKYSTSTYAYKGGGGGGGKNRTIKGISVSPGQTYSVLIGSGGKGNKFDGSVQSTDGGKTQFQSYSVDGGTRSNTYVGGSGGSGGGGGGSHGVIVSNTGRGGSDGGDGYNDEAVLGGTRAGSGQGSTTIEFGESGTLYAGGGGGGEGTGGSGGGGRGGRSSSTTGVAQQGTNNTGGGGGGAVSGSGSAEARRDGADGGSGVVVIRWGY